MSCAAFVTSTGIWCGHGWHEPKIPVLDRKGRILNDIGTTGKRNSHYVRRLNQLAARESASTQVPGLQPSASVPSGFLNFFIAVKLAQS